MPHRYWITHLKANLLDRYPFALSTQEMEPDYDLFRDVDVWWLQQRLEQMVRRLLSAITGLKDSHE